MKEQIKVAQNDSALATVEASIYLHVNSNSNLAIKIIIIGHNLEREKKELLVLCAIKHMLQNIHLL